MAGAPPRCTHNAGASWVNRDASDRFDTSAA